MATLRIADQVGRVLGGRYRLLRPLGTGASAHVYVGEDVSLRRRVAVKVLHPALASDEAFLRRFRAEARVVAALRHPNILRVYDWGEDEHSPYLVSELLEGGSLRTLLDTGNLLSPAQAARMGADAARALAYAHRRGLVHRDVKPANLLFDDEGRVSVADFGLARALAEASWTEPTGAVMGTARYAAPEQARGRSLDARADVYALALVLVEAVSGDVPFSADTTLGTLMARLDRPLPVPASLGPLAGPLGAAGTVEPHERLDAALLAAELDRVGAELAPPAPLVLAGPLASGLVEADPEPTAIEGRGSPSGPPDEPTVWTDHPRHEAGTPARGEGAARRWDDDPTGPGIAPLPPGGQASASKDRTWGDGDGGALEAAPKRRRRRRRGALAALAVLAALGAATGGLFATGVLPPTPMERVPAVVHDQVAVASSALARNHLRLAVTAKAYSAEVPSGAVITQRPSVGRLRRGAAVSVTVSLGPPPVAVPALANLTQSTAATTLAASHLAVGSVAQQASTTVPEGKVISWSDQGATVAQGSRINLVVSSGLPFVAVPPLSASSAQSFSAAQGALAAADLVAQESEAYSTTVPKGQVISTTPGPGAQVRIESQVTVTVSKGPQTTPVLNVAGDSVGAATSALESQGLGVSGVEGNPINTVTGTNPPHGTVVQVGSQVEIITS